MKKSGWIWLPAAFFLCANFFSSENKYLFLVRLSFFLFFIFIYFFLSYFSITHLLPPIIAGISLILFNYGFIQKWILFPIYKKIVFKNNSFFTEAFRIRIQTGRIYTIFSLPTLYAFVCSILLIFILHFALKDKGLKRILWGVLGVLGGTNLILTQSFGGFLYLSLSLLFYLFIAKKIKIKFLWPIIMSLCLFFFIIIGLRFKEAQRLSPLYLRLSNWKQAIRLVEKNPTLGVGLGNYEVEVPKYTYPGEASSIYAHNSLLQIPAETGMPIFILLLMGIVFGIKRNIKKFLSQENSFLSATVLLNLLFNFTDIGIYFFFSGVVFAISISQICPVKIKRNLTILLVLIITSIPLIHFYLTDSWRKTADYYATEKILVLSKKYYEKCLKINPFSYQALLGLANIYWLEGKEILAINLLQKAVKYNPNLGYAYYIYSKIQIEQKEYLTALINAKKAMDSNKKSSLYRKWYEFIQSKILAQFQSPGN